MSVLDQAADFLNTDPSTAGLIIALALTTCIAILGWHRITRAVEQENLLPRTDP